MVHRPAVELERLAPGVDEFGESVAVGIAHLVLGELIAVEEAAQRAHAFDQQGVHGLGARRLVRVALEPPQDQAADSNG